MRLVPLLALLRANQKAKSKNQKAKMGSRKLEKARRGLQPPVTSVASRSDEADGVERHARGPRLRWSGSREKTWSPADHLFVSLVQLPVAYAAVTDTHHFSHALGAQTKRLMA